jgi:hypothetical protein
MKQQLTWSMAVLLLVACGSVTGRAASTEDTGSGPVPVSLGSAGRFAILSKTGITDVCPRSSGTWDQPITGAALLTCGEVSGEPSPSTVGLSCARSAMTFLTAVGDMGFVTRRGGATLSRCTELGAGEIGGLTLQPGLYKWGMGC